MDGVDDSNATGAADDAESFDSTSLLSEAMESRFLNAATNSNAVESAASPVDGSATSETATAAVEAEDPLTLFSWSLRYRANSTFGNGQYEGRLILGAELFIRSGESVEGVLTLLRDKASEVAKKLES